MKFYRLTTDDFAAATGIRGELITPDVRAVIGTRDLAYRQLEPAEKKRWVCAITEKIESGELPRSSPARQADWEKGWAGNLAEYERTGNIYSLMPKYIRPLQPVRLLGDLVMPRGDRFEYDFVDALRRSVFRTYFTGLGALYEFGCGSCQHIPVLAELFPAVRITGLDWTNASLAIMDMLVRQIGFNGAGRMFDLFRPDMKFSLDKESGVLTIGTLEQLGRDFGMFLDYLSTQPVSICVHLETFNELYDEKVELDRLALAFDASRGYLNGFVTALKERARKSSAEIVEVRRIFFSGAYFMTAIRSSSGGR